MKWIKVTDRLPKAREEVLFVNKYRNCKSLVTYGFKASNDPSDSMWFDMLLTDRDGEYEHVYNVTYWMPIPELPGE